ncbi:uncharacterized protein F5147DRAFT_649694 [Suillus discolor]|uniref:F-box domain-containing protein n=1 Tax=Suillus discolor TaxID=1912936 RepID=A0A9P7JXL7_9AGAM|nr:uncharacterized protein F5147DRAFT_649694 [Suillus discolor]KAG2115321.1 hypothetical protein F5147DRAFT_649694 [Suillus discolor]
MDTSQTFTCSLSPVRVISHAKSRSLLLDPVISKRKAADDILDTSVLPFEKRCKFPARRLKRKAGNTALHVSLPPSFRICVLSRSYAIADINAHSTSEENRRSTNRVLSHGTSSPIASLSGRAIIPLIISYWPFPNELVLMIFVYLPARDLRLMTQVSCLSRDLAMPLYFHSVGLSVEQKWLQINAQTCLALPLYSQMASFCTPRFLCCDLIGTSARDLTALQIFLESLMGIQSRPISLVICFDAPPRVDLASLFQVIKNLGCSSFTYSSSDSEQLRTIVPTPVPGSDPGVNIGQVWIHLGQTSVPLELQNHSSQKLRSHTSQQTSNSHLHELTVLGGPSWYLVPLLAAIHPATCIQNLNLQFEEDSTSNHFSAVLDVTQHFTSIHALQLSFFDASHNVNHYDVPCDEHCTVPAKQLTVSVHGPDLDDLLIRCHPWLDTFHELESVGIQAKHTSSSEMLTVLYSHLGNPFQLKINTAVL